ncbi:hypothetical protein [Phenylobacterium ferrooxidans]|uniref:Uncharacterized protein n=1 Tax=Phenylobacterium ferrooxidans TaxID=2982689 RepID=A0ABW6CQQ7_9CAUL
MSTGRPNADAGALFIEQVEQVIRDAKAAGVSMAEVCSTIGASRATHSRWMRRLPATIVVLQRMQDEVSQRLAAKAAAKTR